MLIGAGLGVIAALRIASRTCRSRRIGLALDRAAEQAEQTTVSVSEALAAQRVFPEEFIALWSTGEESGRLDDMLQHLAARFSDRCQNRIRAIGRWIPRIVYGFVMLYLASQIIRGMMNYINLLNSI
jgi:type II secretory pathway component PulF